MNARVRVLVPIALLAVGTLLAQGSTLDRRVTAIGDGRAELHFDAHEETCGDGARWFRYSDDSWYGNWSESGSGIANARAECGSGPVRVLVTVIGREIVRLQTFVGPLQHASDATDLGAVTPSEASTWLLGLAARLDGRPARDAILPAVLAKGVDPTDGLVAVATNAERARETRRSAIGWLARVPRGAGVAPLTRLAESTEDPWLGGEATRALARSGDPRSRAFLRGVVANARASDDVRAAAIGGLGGELATGTDAKLLRDAYRTLTTEKTKEATLTAIAGIGGRANADWLMGVARDEREAPTMRRKAISLSERAGASGAGLSALYDAVGDTETRSAVIAALAQEGSRPARDKLIAIAKSTELPAVRRRAVTALERFDSPEVRETLRAIAMPRP